MASTNRWIGLTFDDSKDVYTGGAQTRVAQLDLSQDLVGVLFHAWSHIATKVFTPGMILLASLATIVAGEVVAVGDDVAEINGSRHHTTAEAVDEGGLFTLTVANPQRVDQLCAPLQSVGRYSCARNGRGDP